MHLLYLGGALGGATVGLYQNGGYDEYLKVRVENVVASELERYLYLCRDILIKNRDFVLALADELY